MAIVDAVVVGCGIIGATVAKVLQGKGLEVLAIDDLRPLAGTNPSGGHLKPSWFSGMGKDQYEPAMELLDKTWGLIEEQFTVWPLGVEATVYRVDTDVVLAYPKVVGQVTMLDHLDNYPLVTWNCAGEVREVRARLLVVATGVWAKELLPNSLLPDITPKQGVSFRIPGKVEPFIRPWAPYKQVVAHQQTAGSVWVGDGSAILPENWTEERTQECLSRCLGAIGKEVNGGKAVSSLGLRPYCKARGNDPCLLERLGPRAWVATGAGKLGTIAAGWVATRLLDVLDKGQ